MIGIHKNIHNYTPNLPTIHATRFEMATLTSVRVGCLMEDNFEHPSICKNCNRNETIKHTFWDCKREFQQYWTEISNSMGSILKTKIITCWEDQFNTNDYQISPRGSISVKLGNLIKVKKVEDQISIWLADIAARFLTKVRRNLPFMEGYSNIASSGSHAPNTSGDLNNKRN
jgi:hypothetical protein